ncbi:MAG TPA: hypothetical protein VN193_06610 [Candidatus Angelobacter sp.]|jgi:hypothetical protein|nr:hypothetical protein [Candidatus Angelobacter sp.]
MTAAVRVRWRAVVVAAVAVTVAVALAGCGKAGTGGAAASPASKQNDSQAMLQFTRCMREHGATVGDAKPKTDGTGAAGAAGAGTFMQINGGSGFSGPQGTIDAAMQACQKYLPTRSGPPPDPAEEKAAFDRALKFAQCMRQHGVDMPDPKQQGSGGIMQAAPSGVDPSSKTFQDAQNACQQYFGPPGGKGGPGPSTQIQGGPGGGAVIGNG